MKTKATIFWLTLAGLTLRIAYFIIFRNELVASSDIINYIALGRQLSAGRPVGVLDTYWTPFYPFLIGIVTMVTGGLILPTVIISVICGTLAVPITYYLVRQSYGSKEATVAALIAVFFPHLINSTFALGTENVYLLLISGALIAGWVAIKADLARFYLITGCLLGLAYLTRPEAFAYPAFFLLLSVASFVIRKSDRSFAILRNAALMLVAFAVFALPYMFYLRAETGAWTISGKTEINSVMSEFSESSEVDGEFNSKPPPDLSSLIKGLGQLFR